jgi:uncharacterized repeat protein (TIGR03803 family)
VYGITEEGGASGGGTIFSLDAAGTLTTVHEFNGAESVGRLNGVIQARDGLFYGTTGFPGRYAGMAGTVFAMDAAGTRTTLHQFEWGPLSGGTGGTPMSKLFEGHDGRLYGTTFSEEGAPIPPGVIFAITPAGDYATVASSYLLQAGVIQAADGRLYGTWSGQASVPSRPAFYGAVFSVDANGARKVLYQFGTDASNPASELLETRDGSLYGTTEGSPPPPPPFSQHGTIFRVDPLSGSVTTVYRFSGPDGSKPVGRLSQGTDGLIYGTTRAGGAFGAGTIFSLDSAGTLTTLHHFADHDGARPSAGVIEGLDGRLYGTTTAGGTFGSGTVFTMNVTGGLTTLHHFAGSDGSSPDTELIQASDGAFYGTASGGGPEGGGVVFRVRPQSSPTDQYVEIVSRHSGKCLDVSGGSPDAAAPVIQWTCHGGWHQHWRLEPAGGDAFRIIARHSGQALDVAGALVDDVTPIIQWPVHGGDNQTWTLEAASDGYVRILARHSGKALDVELASADEGARVIQYTTHGGANQQWLVRVAGSTAEPAASESQP